MKKKLIALAKKAGEFVVETLVEALVLAIGNLVVGGLKKGLKKFKLDRLAKQQEITVKEEPVEQVEEATEDPFADDETVEETDTTDED